MRRAEEDIPMDKKNKAVVTVVGNDTIGIIARVSAALAAHNANILDIRHVQHDDDRGCFAQRF